VLLQTLEAQLLKATNAATRAASAGPHQQRDPNIAANLALDAHRQASCYCCTRTVHQGLSCVSRCNCT
jgi:hypothetical protein